MSGEGRETIDLYSLAILTHNQLMKTTCQVAQVDKVTHANGSNSLHTHV